MCVCVCVCVRLPVSPPTDRNMKQQKNDCKSSIQYIIIEILEDKHHHALTTLSGFSDPSFSKHLKSVFLVIF